MSSDVAPLSVVPVKPWLVRIPEIFEGVGSEVLKRLGGGVRHAVGHGLLFDQIQNAPVGDDPKI